MKKSVLGSFAIKPSSVSSFTGTSFLITFACGCQSMPLIKMNKYKGRQNIKLNVPKTSNIRWINAARRMVLHFIGDCKRDWASLIGSYLNYRINNGNELQMNTNILQSSACIKLVYNLKSFKYIQQYFLVHNTKTVQPV